MNHAHIPPEHFQWLFEAAPGPFLVLLPDRDFTIVGASEQYLRETLTERARIVGRPVFEAFPDNPDTPDAQSTSNLSRSLHRVVASGRVDVMAVQRYDVRRADGQGFEVRYWSPVNAPVFDASGKLAYIVHRVDNVTEYMALRDEHARQRGASDKLSAENGQMEAEIVARGQELDRVNAELRHANGELAAHARQAREEGQRKDEFLAMLAHELRNPLAAISSALQLSELQSTDARRQQEITAICRRQVRHLVRMVDDLLDVSRVDRGAMELRRAPIDLRDVLDSALHTVRELFERQGMMVSTRVAAGSFRLMGDATRLEQVLANLLTNAAKYGGGEGGVELRLERTEVEGEPWARIAVSDAGRGIPADKLEAIFDMFVQVDVSLDRAWGGLGIGLSLVRALVQMHGGRVYARSEGAGRGSCFVVELPLPANLPAAAGNAGDRVAALGGACSRRVLIVEDNPDARRSLQALLEASGHLVATASTGEEGLARLTEFQPDIALIDVGLPGLDGMEVARRARQAEDGRHPVLVALTGYSSLAARRQALEAGFDHHLVKPFDPGELARLLAQQA